MRIKKWFLALTAAAVLMVCFQTAFHSGDSSVHTMPEDGMPYYFQYDDPWSSDRYGEGTIAETGCGPVSLAMGLSDLLSTPVDPRTVASYSDQNGYYVNGAGTAWSLFSDFPAQMGILAWQSTGNESELTEQLKAGNVLLFSMGPGDFTTAGHILASKGIDEQNRTNVHDPNSRKKSHPWHLSDLLRQANAVFVLQRPKENAS